MLMNIQGDKLLSGLVNTLWLEHSFLVCDKPALITPSISVCTTHVKCDVRCCHRNGLVNV